LLIKVGAEVVEKAERLEGGKGQRQCAEVLFNLPAFQPSVQALNRQAHHANRLRAVTDARLVKDRAGGAGHAARLDVLTGV
jgi:hypothetical protein